MLAFSFLIALLLLHMYSAEGTLNLRLGTAQQLLATSTNGWAKILLTHATQLARPFFEVSLDGRVDHLYRYAEMHKNHRQKTQLSLNMNFDPNLTAIGTLDAAEVFLQDDFDPTPEDLGTCPYGDDTALEALMAEAWWIYPPLHTSNCSILRPLFATIFSHVNQNPSPLLDRRPIQLPPCLIHNIQASARRCDKV